MKPPPPNALVNKLVALSLVLLMFAGTLGLGAVWVRQEIFATANRSRVVEAQLGDVERKLDELRAQIATAESVATLLQQNDAMHLALVSPREIQVARVAQDPMVELSRKRAAEAMFGRAPGTEAFPQFRIVAASYNR